MTEYASHRVPTRSSVRGHDVIQSPVLIRCLPLETPMYSASVVAHATHPIIEPIVHVRPYIANASVELLSSVMSPIAAFTTATFPLRAPEMDRMKIIVQKFVARPLSETSVG
jgi:hypothetical protein